MKSVYVVAVYYFYFDLRSLCVCCHSK